MIAISKVKAVKFRAGRGLQANLPTRYIDGFIWFTTDTGKLFIDSPIDGTLQRTLINPDLDWDSIENKPDIAELTYKTKEEWEDSEHEISTAGAIYVYADAFEIDGVSVPGIKIGDGLAYIVDLPYINQVEIDHISDTDIHVSAEDRMRWDNKVRSYYADDVAAETLVFTTN